MGSLYYMSPEQVRDSAALDERTDIYSLGAVLYEMSTGQRPFEAADPFSLILAHVQREPAAPIDIDPSLPPELSQILLTALAKEPDRRFSSASEFQKRLGDVPEVVSSIHIRRWPRSRRMRYGAAALVCATLLIGVEKQELPEAPAAEERPILESAGIANLPAGERSVAPQSTEIPERHPVSPPAEVPKKSTEDKRLHRSWLSRTLSKVVHPRRGQDGEAKR